MKYTTIFFDLDDTLYPQDCGVWQRISSQMDLYVAQTLCISIEEASIQRREWSKKYGTTSRGLFVEKGIDLESFLHHCHEGDLSELIKPNPHLKEILDAIPTEKYILTNSERFHTTRVLKLLGILSCFDGIIDVYDFFPNVKPMKEAFECALHMTGTKDASGCMFFDDRPENVAAAHDLGFFAVQVGGEMVNKKIDAYIATINDLADLAAIRE